MNYDIATELSGIYDLTQSIPNLTTFCIAASGILILIVGIYLILTTKKNVGFHFLPLVYGLTAYFLFYTLIGGMVTTIISKLIPANADRTTMAIAILLSTLATAASLSLGRFGAMWFIKKFYSDYGDAYGIGLGVGLTEGVITAITIFFNYNLCLTINQLGLAEVANSYSSVEEAATQIEALMIFYDTPSYHYLIAGAETIMMMVFHTMISVLFYGVYNNYLKKTHVLAIIGLYTLIMVPSAFTGIDFMFNRVSCFVAELLIIVACVIYFLRVHNTYFKNAKPIVSASKKAKNQPAKMPDFNKNVNKDL